MCIDQRYIIVITPWDKNVIGTQIYLSALPWISFQTRTFQEEPDYVKNMKLQGQVYKPDLKNEIGYNTGKNNVLNDIIEVNNRSVDKTYYISRIYPLNIEVLNNGKSQNEYPDKSILKTVLESYNAVVVIQDS